MIAHQVVNLLLEAQDSLNSMEGAPEPRLEPDWQQDAVERLQADPWSLNKTSRMRLRRLANGLCINCGKEPLAGSAQRCQSCNDKHREHSWIRRKERLEQGFCENCGKNRVEPGGPQKCADCTAVAMRQQRVSSAKAKARGQCAQCGQPAVSGKALCAACAQRDRERSLVTARPSSAAWRAKRRAAGLCARCGQPVAPGTTCAYCAQKIKLNRW